LSLDEIGSLLFDGVDLDDSVDRGDQVRRFEFELLVLDELEDRLGACHPPQQAVVSLVVFELAGVQCCAVGVPLQLSRFRPVALVEVPRCGLGPSDRLSSLRSHRSFYFFEVEKLRRPRKSSPEDDSHEVAA